MHQAWLVRWGNGMIDCVVSILSRKRLDSQIERFKKLVKVDRRFKSGRPSHGLESSTKQRIKYRYGGCHRLSRTDPRHKTKVTLIEICELHAYLGKKREEKEKEKGE